MCEAVSIGLGVAGLTAGIAGSVMSYTTAHNAAKGNEYASLLNAQLQSAQYKMQSQMYGLQASAFGAQSSAYMRQAAAYGQQASAFDQQAAFSSRMGEILQAQSNYRATQTQKEGEEKSRAAAEARRQLVGQAKTAFAGNGVMIEARQGSAVAMWEQDEARDLQFELSQIRTNTENESFGHISNGYSSRLQGLFDAQASAIQAHGARMGADNARMSAINAKYEAANARANALMANYQGTSALMQGAYASSTADNQSNAALWNMIGNIGSMSMTAGSMYANRK